MASTINASTSAGLVSTADTSGVLQLQAANTTVLNAELGKALALQGATSTTGCGIAFPATQSASTDANTLDDYEEGTFSPTVSSGVTTPSYTINSGRYIKVGTLVYINFYFQFNSVQTLNGSQFIVSSLPFSATAPSGGNAGGPAVTACNSQFNSSTTQPLPVMIPSGTTLTFQKMSGANFLGTDISSGNFALTVAGCYYSA